MKITQDMLSPYSKSLINKHSSTEKLARILNDMDECNSIQPHEFIELRSKMYSLKLPNGRIKITTKGVSRSHVLKNLKHKDYLYTLENSKVVLRYIQNNNITKAYCRDSRS